MTDDPPVHERRSQLLEAGLFLVCVVVPLGVVPPARLPFADAKPLFLTTGALLVWLSGVRPAARLVAPAAALGVVVAAAAIAGVDPLESLYGTGRPTGLVMLLPALALVVLAPRIPDELIPRMRTWVVRAALLAAALVLLEHVVPSVLDVILEKERFIGGPFGNPVILAGFLALGVAAALGESDGSDDRPMRIPAWATFAVLGSAFGVIGERSAYLLPVVALAAAWVVARPARRPFLAAAVALLLGVVVWSFVPRAGGEASTSTVASQFETTIGERQRLAVATANLRAVTERPVLGWGPSNAWSAFVSAGTPDEIRTATRTWGDAHDLVIQFAVTTGILGVAALGWLLARLAPGVARSGDAASSWTATGAITLFAFALYEPLDPTLTPLLFLLAGASLRRAGPDLTGTVSWASAPGRAARVGVGALLAASVGVAGLSLASSTLEEWGRTHYGSRWALESARTLAPWRLTATEALAIDLALDARAGDDAAGREARELVEDTVATHPDNPGVRLLAADVEVLLRDEDAARAWIDRQLERFPSDTTSVPDARVAGGSNVLSGSA